MRVSRTAGFGMGAVVGLALAVAAGGLAASGAGRSGAAARLTSTSHCALRYVEGTDSWVCNATPPPPPSSSLGCSIGIVIGGENSEICKGQVSAHAPVTKTWVSGSWEWVWARPPLAGRPESQPGHWAWVPGYLAPAASTAAVQAASVVVHGPPAGLPWTGPPGSAWRKGQPEPQPRPMIFMQVSASLAVAPASVTATAALYDWPAAGPGTVTISVYSGFTADACASPPLRTATAAALDSSGLWRVTLGGLAVGTYELQAQFSGAVGPMSTPCGRSVLKVVAAPGSGQ